MKHNLKTPRGRRGRFAVAAAGLAVVAASTVGGVAAFAGSNDPTYHSNTDGFHACVSTDGSSKLYNGAVYRNAAHPTCPNGYARLDWDKATPPTAPTVTSVNAPGTTLPAIGGSWGTGHVNLGSKALTAGTYLVAVTGDFYKTATTTATPVLQIQVNGLPQQVTAYTGAFPTDPAEGVGLGSDGTPNGLEQTASGYATVVLTAPATAELDAFGYNPDRSGSGSGDFGVIAHATFTKVG